MIVSRPKAPTERQIQRRSDARASAAVYYEAWKVELKESERRLMERKSK